MSHNLPGPALLPFLPYTLCISMDL